MSPSLLVSLIDESVLFAAEAAVPAAYPTGAAIAAVKSFTIGGETAAFRTTQPSK